MEKQIEVQLNIRVIFYRENNKIVAHCPELDVGSVGNNIKEAKKRFQEALDIFLEYTLKKNTLHQELLNLGWTLKKLPKARFIPPNTDDLIRKIIPQEIFIEQTQKKVSIAI